MNFLHRETFKDRPVVSAKAVDQLYMLLLNPYFHIIQTYLKQIMLNIGVHGEKLHYP